MDAGPKLVRRSEAQIAVARQLLRQAPLDVVGQPSARFAEQASHFPVRLALVSLPDGRVYALENAGASAAVPVRRGHGSGATIIEVARRGGGHGSISASASLNISHP